jgi:hypothetical protein
VTLWWGSPWPSEALRAPVCSDDALRVPVPVGKACTLCDVLIEETDRGVSMMGIGEDRKAYPVQEHIECQMRNVMGCFVGLRSDGTEHDHSGSYQDDALRVWAWIQTHPVG